MSAQLELARPGYATVLADPPWPMAQKELCSRGTGHPLMPLAAICALPVLELVTADAHLWLWVTNAALPGGRPVMDAWGFSYRSCLTWIKPRVGVGQYLRNPTEHLLFGIGGRAPEEQHAVIERCSPGPYLELFARRRRPGWHVWGNEVDSDITLPRESGWSPDAA